MNLSQIYPVVYLVPINHTITSFFINYIKLIIYIFSETSRPTLRINAVSPEKNNTSSAVVCINNWNFKKSTKVPTLSVLQYTRQYPSWCVRYMISLQCLSFHVLICHLLQQLIPLPITVWFQLTPHFRNEPISSHLVFTSHCYSCPFQRLILTTDKIWNLPMYGTEILVRNELSHRARSALRHAARGFYFISDWQNFHIQSLFIPQLR